MDWFDITTAPAEYKQVSWMADVAQLAQGLGWAISYALTVHKSFKDQTYGTAILALCNNFAWEFVYTFIYPASNRAESIVITGYILLNLGVMYAAIRFSPREWSHAPLVQKYLPMLFILGILGFISGHVALAESVGVGRAANWGAFLSLELVVVGSLCQLLSRGSSRGASFKIWGARFVGSYVGCVSVALRGRLWPAVFAWLNTPIVRWHIAICFLLDLVYAAVLGYVRNKERRARHAKNL